MGFKNSVSLAQHAHRVVSRQAFRNLNVGGEQDSRKDQNFPLVKTMYRIYLDKFDELRKVSKKFSTLIEGEVSPLIEGLRDEYGGLGIPRRPNKSVSSKTVAEVQGAVVDGVAGVATPKPEKIAKYCHLGKLRVQSTTCTQKQVQVVGGGFVYFSMAATAWVPERTLEIHHVL